MGAPIPGYVLLADLLQYPDSTFLDRARRNIRLLEERRDPGPGTLAPFRDTVLAGTVEEAQELFTRTFDINPVCTLEVGWHIYGEDYARGAFLVKMRRRMADLGIPESAELPDYLIHVLAVLGRLDGEEAEELAARYVLPALGKMLEGLSGTENPYRAVLQAVIDGVKHCHPVEAVAPRRRRGDPPGWANRLPMLGGAVPGREGNNGVR